jgi:hypothetical protein
MGAVSLAGRGQDAQWGKAPGATAPGASEEIQFLQGPQRRSFELWRAVKIFGEFLHGFRTPCSSSIRCSFFDQRINPRRLPVEERRDGILL